MPHHCIRLVLCTSILCSVWILLSLISAILLVAKDSILKKNAFVLCGYFKAQWVQVDSLRNGKYRIRLRKHQSSNIERCEMFPVPAHYFSQKEFLSLRGFFLPQKEGNQDLQTARLSWKSSFLQWKMVFLF